MRNRDLVASPASATLQLSVLRFAQASRRMASTSRVPRTKVIVENTLAASA